MPNADSTNPLRRSVSSLFGLVALSAPVRIGSFHKTGTVLWATILRDLAQRTRLSVWRSDRTRAPRRGWDVEFNDHCAFASGRIDMPTLVCIRDPRDVVISAAKYHVWADEPWLRDPSAVKPGDVWPQLGATYQDAISALRTQKEQLLFEMDHSSGRTIRAMLDMQERFPDAKIVKLETLMADTELTAFAACFDYLEFPDALRDQALTAAHDNSIFGDKAKGRTHIQSGRPAVWREVFDDELFAAFATRFGDAAERLGYPAA